MHDTDTSPALAATSDGAGNLPRNAARLAARADAAGWRVTTSQTPRSATVRLTAQIMAGRGSVAVAVVCLWQADAAGKLRWERAVLMKDGKQLDQPYNWPQVSPLLARLGTGMIDPDQEKTGATCHGRGAERWDSDVTCWFKVSIKAYWHAAEVRDLLQEQQVPGAAAAWTGQAFEATAALHRRLVRRCDRAQDVVLLAEREVSRASEQGRTADARRVFQLAERARVLAESCSKDADAIEAAALAAEAEALCAPYVAARAAEVDAQERAWRAEHPGGGAQDFARTVLKAFEVPALKFAEWWQESARPGMTFAQGWDACCAGEPTHAETLAGAACEKDTYLAVFALGAVAAAQLRADERVGQAQRAELLEAAARHGASLYAPGASRRIGEGPQAAARVWTLLVGGTRDAWLSLELRENLAALEPWGRGVAAAEAGRLRTLLLVDHGLRLRQAAHAAVREELEAARARRYRAAHEVYEAELAGGAGEVAARQAQRDVLARLEAEERGREQDGRERFARGDDVWVEPSEGDGSVAAGRYAARMRCYCGQGVFLVDGFAEGAEHEVTAGRLSEAGREEAEADRARQVAVAERLREEAEARAAEARQAQEQVLAEQRLRRERQAGRERAAAGTLPPLAPGEEWRPAHALPPAVGELWSTAARNGWRMACWTAGESGWSVLQVAIGGTTEQGRWAFHLVWSAAGGRYGVSKAHSTAVWADRRSGPRGGKVRPTITDVMAVMAAETFEGAAAAPGHLVGGPGRPVGEAGPVPA
ncbi:hypothetical protein F7Q99_36205 [Streptomyces kaniharaensis]|uniref:Uncharacterized protein n=1 Tax=Streptomyces kaniharaensis TaxID=212423 RepID=A0A6N7L0H4_9ACTN|nr:hypothetical protein [Streptomyces kaniharaensis]MQS17486.1 hypothetical protein [Streptomyces kaniharaensis]